MLKNGYSLTISYDAFGHRRLTRHFQGNYQQKVKASISDLHEVEVSTTGTRKIITMQECVECK